MICGAKKRNGQPCRLPAMKHTTRCRIHGGASPLARHKVQEILASAAMPAVTFLLRVLEDWERTTCRYCGFPRGDPGPVIKAAQVVLDRSGFHPTLTIQASRIPEDAAWVRWLTRGQAQQVEAIIADAKRRMAAHQDPPSLLPEAPVVVESEIIKESL